MTKSRLEFPAIDLTDADNPLRGRPAMTEPSSPHAFLSARQVIARYGWGRTKGYRILRSEGFPRPIGGDRYRLDALVAWENAQLDARVTTRSAPSLPARKRRTARSA